MIIPIRIFVVVILSASFLGGCFKTGEETVWDVEADGKQSTFAVPQKVSYKTEPEYLSARVRLDDGEWQPLPIIGGSVTGRMQNISEGVHRITLQFEYNDPKYGRVILAQATKRITIVPAEQTRLVISDNDYDLLSFDNDNDGFSNAHEIKHDTDPLDGNDPGNMSSSSQAGSSSEVATSSSASSLPSVQSSISSRSLALSSSSASSSTLYFTDLEGNPIHEIMRFAGDKNFTLNVGGVTGALLEFTSSDNTIASVDPEGGNVTIKRIGTVMLIASIDGSTNMAEVPLTVQSYQGKIIDIPPDPFGVIDQPYTPYSSIELNFMSHSARRSLEFIDNYAFVAGNSSIISYDISNESMISMAEISFVDTEDVTGICANEDSLFVSGNGPGGFYLREYSLTSGQTVKYDHVGQWFLGGAASMLHVFGDILYAGLSNAGIVTVDITKPSAIVTPFMTTPFVTSAGEDVEYLADDGRYLYVGSRTTENITGISKITRELKVIDVENAKTELPVIVGRAQGISNALGASSGYIFIQKSLNSDFGFKYSTINDAIPLVFRPSYTTEKNIINENEYGNHSFLEGSILFATSFFSFPGDDFLEIIDVADHLAPVRKAKYKLGVGVSVIKNHNSHTYILSETHLYVFDTSSGIELSPDYDNLTLGEPQSYTVSWNTNPRAGGGDEIPVKCWVSIGTCDISNVDMVNHTADVLWRSPSFDSGLNDNGHHQIMVAAGDNTFYTADYDRVRVTKN